MELWFTEEEVITIVEEEEEEAISQEAAGAEADLPDVVGDRAADIKGFTNILAAAK
jgi:hypothetical protein